MSGRLTLRRTRSFLAFPELGRLPRGGGADASSGHQPGEPLRPAAPEKAAAYAAVARWLGRLLLPRARKLLHAGCHGRDRCCGQKQLREGGGAS